MRVVGGLAIVAGALGAGLHAANAAASRTVAPSFWMLGMTTALAYGTLALVLRRCEAVRIRRTVASIALTQGVALLAQEWASLGPDVPLREWAQWLGAWLWAPGYVAVGAVLPLLLPDARLPSRRWRPALWLSVAAVVLSALWWGLTPYEDQDFPLPHVGMTNPVAIAGTTHPVVVGGWQTITVGAVVLASASLVVRWRRAVDVERQQLKWVLLGIMATLVLAVIGRLMPVGVTEVVSGLAMLPLPAAIGVAVLRHGLWDVDVVISRALVLTLLAVLAVGVYVVAVWLLGGLLGASAGAPIAATAMVAVVVMPLHARLRGWVNRRVHGDADEPYAVLARLGDRLASATTPEDLAERVVPSVVEQVARALRAGGARLSLADGSAAQHGTTSGTANRIALEFAGVPVGELTVWRTGGFDRGDTDALDRLARQSAVAAHTVLLARESQRARESVVLAREEERRRLRRDLHDDVGPSLAALALHVETARDLATDDPTATAMMLDRLVPRLNATVADVRALVHELRPPTLDELGLATAVRELGARLAAAGTEVVTCADDLGILPAAAEVAAYRIAGEAVSNAVRHAAASRVQVTLRREGDILRVEVVDDGDGLPVVRRVGVGLTSMRLRAEELGGSLEITAGSPGTCITAMLPLAAVP